MSAAVPSVVAAIVTTARPGIASVRTWRTGVDRLPDTGFNLMRQGAYLANRHLLDFVNQVAGSKRALRISRASRLRSRRSVPQVRLNIQDGWNGCQGRM